MRLLNCHYTLATKPVAICRKSDLLVDFNGCLIVATGLGKKTTKTQSSNVIDDRGCLGWLSQHCESADNLPFRGFPYSAVA
jgi:hypothetical protein